MPVARIPLVGSLINRNENPSSFTSKDQVFINCYPEINTNKITGTSRVYLYKRQGIGVAATVSGTSNGSFGACIRYSTGTAALSLSSSGAGVKVFDNSGVQIGGNITGNICRHLSETSISGTANLVAITSNGSGNIEGWFYPTGGAWTQITDTDFPPASGNTGLWSAPVHMDGFMFYMDPATGKIYNSDLNSLSSWSATSFISAQMELDGGVSLVKRGPIIVAFGQRTMEFFRNAGNATGSPLEVIPSMGRRIGAYAQDYINSPYLVTMRWNNPLVYSGDEIFWIGRNSETDLLGIYRLEGYEPKKISTPAIDKLLNDASVYASDTIPPSTSLVSLAGCLEMHGMTHLICHINPASSVSYAYCLETGVWWKADWQMGSSPGSCLGPYCTFSTTKIGKVANATYTDNGNAFTATVQTELLDFGTQKVKFFRRVRPVCDLQSSASNISISWADDDSWSFSTPVTIDTSSQTAINDGITGLGSARRRSFKITHAANTPLRIEALELEYDVGTN